MTRCSRLALTLALILSSGCAASPPPPSPTTLIAPDAVTRARPWTAEELEREIAIQNLGSNATSSFHLIRARGAEQPHVHDKSDLVVTLLTGQVKVHLAERIVDAHAGDVINIPRGTPHWVENVGPEPSLSVALFSPPFDGKDRRFIGP